MGTNYYWRDGVCAHCARYTELHVCKSMRTWRAYPHDMPINKHFGFEQTSPLGFPIMSIADWQKVLQRPGELRDEYDRVIDDPLAWLAEAKPYKPPLNDTRDYLAEDIQLDIGWLDDQGYRFYAGEFC